MAPRTKEQQIAYNEKRRAVSAAKKAPEKHPILSKLTETGLKRIIAKEAKASVQELDKAQRKSKATVAKAVKTTKAMKAEPTKFAAKTASAKPIKGVDEAPAKRKVGKLRALDAPFVKPSPHVKKVVKHVIDKMKARDANVAPERINSRIPNATMASAYMRQGAPGAGLQRGKNFQATVTFTPEQFAQLRDKALFNHRSLAEQIRWSVIQTL